MAEAQQPDTVPPPPGEDDLYSAETRVGPLPQDLLDSLRAIRRAEEPPEISTNLDEYASEEPPPPSEREPVSVPARSMASEDLPLRPGVPDLEGTESESTEPTFDKPIRYIKRAEEVSVAEEQLPTGVAFGSRGMGPLFLLAVIAAGFAAAFLAWKLG